VSAVPRPAATRVDHYELVEHLADGAQAEVYRAKDLLSGEEVVIKFPHARVLDHPVLALLAVASGSSPRRGWACWRHLRKLHAVVLAPVRQR
jgi:serine/threonine protein kinase